MWGLLMLLHTKSSFVFLHCPKKSHRPICLPPHLCTIEKTTGSQKDEKFSLPEYGRTPMAQSLWPCHVLQRSLWMVWYWLFGTGWDTGGTMLLLPVEQQVEAGVSYWGVSSSGCGGCNCLKASSFPQDFVFRGYFTPWQVPGLCQGLICLLQQDALCASISSLTKQER